MKRTFLLGLDGATFDVLDPYVANGLMPNLGKLVQRGVTAQLDSIVPALTPPAWTSVMTGKRPGKHGVFDFFQKEDATSIHYRFANSQDVKAATIWQLVGEAGGTSLAVNFPLMFPAPPIEGRVVPGGMMPWRQLRLGCHPAGLFNRLKQIDGFNAKSLLDMELEVKATEGAPDDEALEYVDLHIVREEGWGAVAKALVQDEVPDLVGIMFDGVDKLQHLTYRFVNPALRPAEPTAWEQQMIDEVERYFRVLDGIIGDLLELVGDDATVVCVSDHGFGATEDVFHVNTWLEQQGLLHWADEGGAVKGDGTAVGFQEVTRHVRALDWSRTVAYAATPSSQGIMIVDKVPGTEDPLPIDVRRDLRTQIADGLREVTRPRDGQPVVKNVWMRDEAFAGVNEAIGPDVTIELADCGTISILPGAEVMTRRPELRGHHRPDGVLVAAGPEIAAGGGRVDACRLIDVAPLVLHTMGLPVPEDMDGVVPPQLFADGALEERPVQFSAATEATVTADAPDVEFDEEDQASVMKRLKALGYVE